MSLVYKIDEHFPILVTKAKFGIHKSQAPPDEFVKDDWDRLKGIYC